MGEVAGDVVEDVVVQPGTGWSMVVPEKATLRIVDLEGKQAVDFLCYDAADPSERYNACDSMKVAGTIQITTGHRLLSDMGRALFTVGEDTYGNHDTIGGCCSAESNMLRYGEPGDANCRDTFVRELGKHGLGKRDITTNLNFFMNVPVHEDGRMYMAEGFSQPGDYVELHAERDVLAVISNCAQVHNPVNGYNPTPIRVVVYRAQGRTPPIRR